MVETAQADKRDITLRSSNLIAGIAVFVMVCCGLGCEPHADPARGRIPDLPKPPPAYPRARTGPLDPALQVAARKELDAALRAPDPNVRAHALESVRQTMGPQRAREVIAALDDPDPLVRYAACLATGESQLKDAHVKLLGLVHDRDPRVGVVARFALHRIGDYRYSHDLEKLSRDPDPAVRGTTAMVLGMLGDQSGMKILYGMRLDPHPAVRQQAAEAMWRLGSEEGLQELVGWSISRYQEDQMIGLLGLAAPRNHNVIEHLRGGLVNDSPVVSLVAARALGMIGCDEGYGVALIGAKSADPQQRLLAAFAFGSIGRGDAQDVLRKLLADADPNVRVAAAQAILQLKPDFHSECSRSA